MTALEFDVMTSFVTIEEQADCYLEKPLAIKDLIALLKILSII